MKEALNDAVHNKIQRKRHRRPYDRLNHKLEIIKSEKKIIKIIKWKYDTTNKYRVARLFVLHVIVVQYFFFEKKATLTAKWVDKTLSVKGNGSKQLINDKIL